MEKITDQEEKTGPEGGRLVPGDLDGFVEISAAHKGGGGIPKGKPEIQKGKTEIQKGGDAPDDWSGRARFLGEIGRLRPKLKDNSTECVNVLTSFLASGKMAFTSQEVSNLTGIRLKKVSRFLLIMQEKGLVKVAAKNGIINIYTFGPGKNPLSVEDYSRDYLKALDELVSDTRSSRDIRLGHILKDCMPSGCVTATDYEECANRWEVDMQLACQMGLVMKVTDSYYLLTKRAVPRLDTLDNAQKRQVIKMYESFGDGAFSLDMAVAALSYDVSTASSYLHRFRLLRILGYRKEEGYQFLVSPEKNPECFELTAA